MFKSYIKNFILIVIFTFTIFIPCYANMQNVKTGYFYFKKRTSYVHSYVPENYNPKKKYPLIIALHRKEGTGEEFISQIQIDAKNNDFIIACPDSFNKWSWEISMNEFKNNASLLKTILKYFVTKYNIDPDKKFLLGQGDGAKYLLFLYEQKKTHGKITKKSLLKNISGIIISGYEEKTKFFNKQWQFTKDKSNINKYYFMPILFLYSNSDVKSNHYRARWTRDFLRKNNINVHYIEGDWRGYPLHLNNKIFKWCLNEKKSIDELPKIRKNQTIVVTEEYNILEFRPNDKKNIVYKECPATKNHKKFFVKFKINSDKIEDNSKKNLDDIRVIIDIFDKNKKRVFNDQKAYFGLEPGGKAIRDYKNEFYNISFDKSNEQIFNENSLRKNELVSVDFFIPPDRNIEYASLKIYKSNRLVAFKMYPPNTNNKEFEDLKNIIFRTRIQNVTKKEDDDLIDYEDDEKPGVFRIVE